MKLGAQNDPSEVRILQQLLNKFVGTNLSITGTFDIATANAVKAFQKAYAADILAPWGVSQPTGFVYLTTRKKLNELNCGEKHPLSPKESSIITAYRSHSQSNTTSSGSNAVVGTTHNSNNELIPVAQAAETSNTSQDAQVGFNTTPGSSNTQVGAAAQSNPGFFGILSSMFKKLFGH